MNQDVLAKVGKVILFVAWAVILIGVFALVVLGGRRVNLAQPPYVPAVYKGGVGLGNDKDKDAMIEMMPLSQSISNDGMLSSPPMMRGNQVVAPSDVTFAEIPAESSESAVATNKKVIKIGSLTLRIDDANWSVGEITRVAGSLGGSVESSNISNDGQGVKSGTIVVRVPAEKFNEAFAQLKQSGKVVVNESVSGTDVTEQVIDLEARIKNKQAEEEAYANILKAQATKVSDVLEVTRALNTVRGEIESLQGQLKYLNSQANMSTISIFLSEDPQIGQTDTTWRPWQVVKASVNALLVNLQGRDDFLKRLIIVVLPIFLLIFGILGWILWKVGKKIFRSMKGE
jgi:hypothetical protein